MSPTRVLDNSHGYEYHPQQKKKGGGVAIAFPMIYVSKGNFKKSLGPGVTTTATAGTMHWVPGIILRLDSIYCNPYEQFHVVWIFITFYKYRNQELVTCPESKKLLSSRAGIQT